MKPTIAGLFVYPVKSCRGIALDAARLTERGIEHDREWMIVDSRGRFLTQREAPRLALVAPTLCEATLEFAAPGMDSLTLALDQSGPARTVEVWRDTLSAIDQGEQAAGWLSAWIGQPVRLVRFDPAVRRRCDPAFAGSSGAHTAFADGYPLLVLSQASLTDLNARMAKPLPVDRFRPNVLLSGIEAYDEDHIDKLDFGAARLTLVKPCTRCRITTTDQATAEVGMEPLATLGLYRHNAALDGVSFGVNAVVEAGAGAMIALGAAATYSFRF